MVSCFGEGEEVTDLRLDLALLILLFAFVFFLFVLTEELFNWPYRSIPRRHRACTNPARVSEEDATIDDGTPAMLKLASFIGDTLADFFTFCIFRC